MASAMSKSSLTRKILILCGVVAVLLIVRLEVSDQGSNAPPDSIQNSIKVNTEKLNDAGNVALGSRTTPLPPIQFELGLWTDPHRLCHETLRVLSEPDHLLASTHQKGPRNSTLSTKPFHILGLGVHMGPPQDTKHLFTRNEIGLKITNWGNHAGIDEKIINTPQIIRGYKSTGMRGAQETFWKRYKNLVMDVDAFLCYFDAWHCLLFAPFNKPIIINNAYRFEGHIKTNEARHFQLLLQKILKHHPGVIVGGTNLYDVAYANHYLGTTRIMPLLAVGDYVRDKMAAEIRAGQCPGVPKDTDGYHPTKDRIIGIGPKRLSGSADQLAANIVTGGNTYKFNQNSTFKFKSLATGGHYKYCHLGEVSAIVLLPYSIHSYYGVEIANLGIPIFMPSPQLYAEWIKTYGIAPERKNDLKATTDNQMVEHPLSFNKGFNPNDDLDTASTAHWVSYADYYYWPSVIFSSLDGLYKKLDAADFSILHKRMIEHREKNRQQTLRNWVSIKQYFQSSQQEYQERPTTFQRGMDIWEEKIAGT